MKPPVLDFNFWNTIHNLKYFVKPEFIAFGKRAANQFNSNSISFIKVLFGIYDAFDFGAKLEGNTELQNPLFVFILKGFS